MKITNKKIGFSQQDEDGILEEILQNFTKSKNFIK